MGTPKTIVQLYHLAHIQMLGAVRAIFNLFVADKADFIGFDPDFADPFESNWQSDMAAADLFDSDEIVLDIQRQLTEAVEAKMDACRHKFQGSKYFIEKPFSDNGTILDEFGYNNYREASYKQLELIFFMKEFHKTAEKYKVQLLAANYTQPMIDEILTLHDTLEAANDAQEKFFKDRRIITRNRQIAYNKIWETLVTVCKAGQNIYHDNSVKYEQYTIPRGDSSSQPKKTITFSVKQNPLKQIRIQLLGADGKKVTVDWGDGSAVETYTLTSSGYITITHDYTSIGNYQIKLTAEVAGFVDILAPDNQITAVNFPEGLTELRTLDFINNFLLSFFFPTTSTKIQQVLLANNEIDQQSGNSTVVTINGFGTNNGGIDLSGGANQPLSGQGIAAKNQLIARGWNVVTN